MVKEVCEPCSRPINIGHSILECEVCSTAIHTKCYKSSGFCPTNNLWVCKSCSHKIIPRYNPFEILTNGDIEKFYDDEAGNEEDTICIISDILNQCKNYKSSEIEQAVNNLQVSQKSHNIGQFSSYFINIDGNASNFDSLLVELQRHENKFSVVHWL